MRPILPSLLRVDPAVVLAVSLAASAAAPAFATDGVREINPTCP